MSRPARIWLVAFLGFLLTIGAWSLAAPYDGTPDEFDHVVRAAGVAQGQFAPPAADAKNGTGAFQTVPQGLVRKNCWAFDPTRSAACAEPPDGDRTPTVAPSGAGRYFPPYYAAVGLPLVWWPGWGGLLAARLIGAVASAALLASAVTAIARRPRYRLMLAGMLVGLTPMATSMASAVNPNGLEMAAGIGFFTGLFLLVLRRDRVREPDTGLVVLTGISAVLLAVLRTSSLLWLVVGVAAVALPWRRLAGLLRSRAVLVWTAVVVVAGGFAALWIVTHGTTDLGDYTGGRRLDFGQALFVELDNWRGYLDQAVGVTGWLDTRMPTAVYLWWELAGGALVFAAVVAGTRGDRWRLAVVGALGLVLPALLEVRMANETGFITQGRYLLPALGGLALLAAFVLAERGLPARATRTAIRFAVLALLPVHLLLFLHTVARWQHGLPDIGQRGFGDLDPLAGDWHPIAGSLTVLLLELAGLVIVGFVGWRLAAVPEVWTGRTVSLRRVPAWGPEGGAAPAGPPPASAPRPAAEHSPARPSPP